MNSEIDEIAGQLLRSEKQRVPIDPLTSSRPELTASVAYAIQMRMVQRKIESGERVAGKKIGLTSLAIQQMLGVFEPDYGHLFHSMRVADGGSVPANSLIQPKIEGEIAFVLKNALSGPGVTLEDVLQATEYVAPALEIIDSRIRNWEIKLADTVADNGSSAMFVVGTQRTAPRDRNLSAVEMVLRRNEEPAVTGTGAAVMGNPVASVAWLANKLSEFGVRLLAGEVILSGSIGKAIDVRAGDSIQADFDGLGSVRVHFT